MLFIHEPKGVNHGITETQQARQRQVKRRPQTQVMAVDYALAALWLALMLKNRAAILPLFVLLIDCYAWSSSGGIARCCLVTSVYFAMSAFQCTPNYLRNPLLASGSLYWVGAFDELLYNYFDLSTVYYDVMPYLVIMLNAYIALVLILGGGLNCAGIAGRFGRLVNSWRIGL